MSFEEFGEELRRLREGKGLTVEDVARRIKIPARTLHDFEKGEQSQTLHPVYCRGFVKAYAEFLGMDKQTLEPILSELYPPEDEDYESPVLIVGKRNRGGSGKAVLLILIALLSAGIWYVYTHGWPEVSWLSQLTDTVQSNGTDNAAQYQEPENQIDGQSSTLTTAPVVAAAPDSATPQIEAGPAPPAAEITDAQEHRATITPGEEAVIAENMAPPVQTNATMSGEPDENMGPHRLVIATSNQDCWTESRVDSEEKRQVYLKSGQTHILTFQEKLTLRLGNISGVKIRLDGEDYEIPSGQGATRDLIFDFSASAQGNTIQ